MFEKLLANLPFKPSLVHQLSFYAKRMKAERSLRRIGLAFIALAFLVQFFAFISPPQSTSASSTNDLVNGGFTSAPQAAWYCNNNVNNYGTILANYGITCAKVASAQTVTYNDRAFGGNLWSMGWLPGSDFGKTLPGQTPVNIDGLTLYVRYLWGWDAPGTTSTYQMLNVTNTGGQTFLLMYPCGNLVSVGQPVPVAPPAPPAPPPAPTPAPTPKPPVCNYDSAILATSPLCVPCSSNPTIIASSSQCKPCAAALSSEDVTACVIPHKTVANITEGIADANGTTAQAGDVLQYTIYADNTGDTPVPNYVFQDYLTYILDYSTIVNAGGGTLNSSDVLIWPAQDLKAKTAISEQFEVKIDNPIPQTPVSTSDPLLYNMTMTNIYGNTVETKLPPSPAQVVETTTTALPNTGPGDSLVIAAVIVAVAGYFFFRSRILVEESGIAIEESIQGGL